VGAGTGAALDIARKGNVDLVMAHARSLEEKFVEEGYGTERVALMYNDFVILGPANDPAGIRGMKSAGEALKKIADKGTPFITRGDRSGTHVSEMELWQKAGVNPRGSWYQKFERGTEGNAPTLKYTDEKQAYTFMDRATYLSLKNQIRLVILVEKDELLLNFISLIPVNPQKFPRVNHGDTMNFVKWLTSPEKGQKIISDFGKDKYGAPLFFANSKEWREKQGLKK
jgi:tungstate transport system substrate-binding protein